jgi:radical SAM protein with 4Fe4S-binding SPASM domain
LSEPSSFFTYSSSISEEMEEKAHVLLHPYEPRWMVVNDTGLEIAGFLDKGESVDDVAGRLSLKYGISAEKAKQDISFVSERLTQQHFLNGKTTRPTERSPALKTVFFHLTSRCNLSCPHCYVSCPDKNANQDLPSSLVLRLIDELANKGGQLATFSGGEPLLHPEIKKILKYTASKVGIRLLTNGTLIDREWAAFLADMDISIQISLDGSKKPIHDTVRGEGSFDKAIRAVEYLQTVGLQERIVLSTTVMRQNIQDLRKIITLAERLDIPFVRFLPLRKIGRARLQWDSIGSGIGVKEYEQFYQYTADLQTNRHCSVEISCGLSGVLLKLPNEFSGDDIWCPIGRQLTVGVNGDAYPCVLMMNEEFRLGNVFQDSLSRMIQSKRMESVCKALSDRRVKIKKCEPCHWRNLCQGGCMGLALDHKEIIWDTDDFCDYRKRAYQELFDKILKNRT